MEKGGGGWKGWKGWEGVEVGREGGEEWNLEVKYKMKEKKDKIESIKTLFVRGGQIKK